ncbi:MAG: hypothetical protein ABEK10_05030 [Candidatus Nanosalina sp.]
MDEVKQKLDAAWRSFSELGFRARAVFMISTFIMVLQHLSGWSWDFLVYSMNGEYMLAGGFFMEWLRPPLASVFLGLPQVFLPRSIAEILFIVAVSSFFLYASRRVAEQYDLNFTYFYLLLMTPVTIYFGTRNGTEMLSLALAMMFFAEIKNERSGAWLGLTFLARYNYGAIIPLTLIQRKPLKILKTLLISAVPVSLWLGYNYLVTGHPLTSFANFLGLNVLRRSASEPLNPVNFLIVGLPSAVLLLLYAKKEFREQVDIKSDAFLFLAGFTVLNSLIYVSGGFKPLRYLYPLVLPIAFYAARAAEELDINHLVDLLSGMGIAAALVLVLINPLAPPGNFEAAAESARGCMTESNVWPMINYAGTQSYPVTYRSTEEKLSEGYRIIDYRNQVFGENSSLPVIAESELYTVYGYEDRCREPLKADRTWITGLNEKTGKNYTPESFLFHEVAQLWR